jgi:hypothetical protein
MQNNQNQKATKMNTTTPVQQSKNHRNPAKIPCQLCLAISVFVLGPRLADATTIFLDSGVSGSTTINQSYNENRGVDVTVLSPQDLLVTSMTLSGIGGTGTAEAEIYNSNTQALIASASGTLTGGTITLSISAILQTGSEYRIAYGGNLRSGNGFLPSTFPYTETSGLLRINGSWDGSVGSFPNTPNFEVPEISLNATAVPEPATLALLGISAAALLCRRRNPNN